MFEKINSSKAADCRSTTLSTDSKQAEGKVKLSTDREVHELYRKEGVYRTITYFIANGLLYIEIINHKEGSKATNYQSLDSMIKDAESFRTVQDWCKHDVKRVKRELKEQDKLLECPGKKVKLVKPHMNCYM